MEDAEAQTSTSSPIDCCICYSSQWEYLGVLSCQHLFCFDCIKRWGATRQQCPICLCSFVSITKRRLDRTSIATLCCNDTVDARTLPGEDVEEVTIHRPPSYPLQDLLFTDVHESLYEVLQEYFTATQPQPDTNDDARSHDENNSMVGNTSEAMTSAWHGPPEPHPLFDLHPETHPLSLRSRAYTVSTTRPHVAPHATDRAHRHRPPPPPLTDTTTTTTSPSRWHDITTRMLHASNSPPPFSTPTPPRMAARPPPPHPHDPPQQPSASLEHNLHDLRIALQELRAIMDNWGNDVVEPGPWAPLYPPVHHHAASTHTSDGGMSFSPPARSPTAYAPGPYTGTLYNTPPVQGGVLSSSAHFPGATLPPSRSMRSIHMRDNSNGTASSIGPYAAYVSEALGQLEGQLEGLVGLPMLYTPSVIDSGDDMGGMSEGPGSSSGGGGSSSGGTSSGGSSRLQSPGHSPGRSGYSSPVTSQDGLRVGRSSPRLPLDWRTIPFLLRATGGPFSPRQSLWALCGVRNPAGDQHAAPTYTPTFEERELLGMAARVFTYLASRSTWPLGPDWPLPLWLRSAAVELQVQQQHTAQQVSRTDMPSTDSEAHDAQQQQQQQAPIHVPPFMQPAVALLVHDMYLATLASPGAQTLPQLMRHAARGLCEPVAPPVGPGAYWLQPTAQAMGWETRDTPTRSMSTEPQVTWRDIARGGRAVAGTWDASTSPRRPRWGWAPPDGPLTLRFSSGMAPPFFQLHHPFAASSAASEGLLRRQNSVPTSRRMTVQGDDGSLSRTVSQLPRMQPPQASGHVVAVWDGRDATISRRASALHSSSMDDAHSTLDQV